MTETKLTAKQEAFCQNIALGMTQKDAYLAAYDVADNCDNTLYSNASQLMTEAKIAQRVKELKERALKRHDITVDSIMDELEEARALGRQVKQPASMVSASMGKAKVAGLIIEKRENTGKDGGPLVVSVPAEASARIVESVLKKLGREPHPVVVKAENTTELTPIEDKG